MGPVFISTTKDHNVQSMFHSQLSHWTSSNKHDFLHGMEHEEVLLLIFQHEMQHLMLEDEKKGKKNVGGRGGNLSILSASLMLIIYSGSLPCPQQFFFQVAPVIITTLVQQSFG